jgi:hypothetical protein
VKSVKEEKPEMSKCDFVELAADHSEIEQLSYRLSDSADWRRFKAGEYPNDAECNLKAAMQLDKLAAEAANKIGSDLDRSERKSRHDEQVRKMAAEIKRRIAEKAEREGVDLETMHGKLKDAIAKAVAEQREKRERRARPTA